MPWAARKQPATREDGVVPLPTVAMIMDAGEAREVASWLAEHRGQPAMRLVKDALWLRAVLLRAQRGMSTYERRVLRERGDRVLQSLLRDTE